MPEKQLGEGDPGFEARLVRLEAEVATQRRMLWGLVEALIVAGCAVPFAVAVLKFPRPDSLPFKLLFDLGHVVLSGLAAAIVLRLSRRLFGDVIRIPAVHYLLAAAVATGAGVALEVFQMVGPGEPSLGDAIRDVLGVLAGLSVALSFDAGWGSASLLRRLGLRFAAVVFVVASFAPAARTIVFNVQQRSQFPVLATFESDSENRFVEAGDGAELQLVEPPATFGRAQGTKVGKVVFGTGEYPKLELTGVNGDWSRYESFVFDVFSAETEPVRVELRVHDRRHSGAFNDRFNAPLLVAPGESAQVVSIERIRMGPEEREVDLRAIEAVILFVESPTKPITLYVDSFRLE